MAIIPAYESCTAAPILRGTGQLFVLSGADELDLGNFSLVDLVTEGSAHRTFAGADEVASAVGATSEYRLELTGDTFTPANLARLLNEELVGDSIAIRTVRDLAIYQLRFRKLVPREDCAEAYFDLYIWRAYLEVPVTYTFSQDEQTVHRFIFIVIPDPVGHPDNPIAQIEFVGVG
jgi:hypothetical protein